VLDDATGGLDRRHDLGPVLVSIEDLGRRACLAERGEVGQVGEQHADPALLGRGRRRRIDAEAIGYRGRR
jgi:hypothetical protein